MDSPRDLFLKYDYPEAKDLCKQFLTLNVGVVVLSLTFADKVIGLTAPSYQSKILLLCSWSCLLASLAGCGVSLAYISIAAGRVVYGERTDFYRISVRTLVGVAVSGAIFVIGLILLALASAVALLR